MAKTPEYKKEIKRIEKIMDRDKLISKKEVIKIILDCDHYYTDMYYYIVPEEDLKKIRNL